MVAQEAAELKSQAILEIQMNHKRSFGKLALRPDSSKLSESTLRGRDITASDEHGSVGAAVIDEIVAEKLFPNADPIGKQITIPLAGGTFSVVGVVAATKSGSLSAAPKPRIIISVRRFHSPR